MRTLFNIKAIVGLDLNFTFFDCIIIANIALFTYVVSSADALSKNSVETGTFASQKKYSYFFIVLFTLHFP